MSPRDQMAEFKGRRDALEARQADERGAEIDRHIGRSPAEEGERAARRDRIEAAIDAFNEIDALSRAVKILIQKNAGDDGLIEAIRKDVAVWKGIIDDA